MDWLIRIKIVIGVVKVFVFLYVCGGFNFVYGNIKFINILFNRDFEVCIFDFGLVYLFSVLSSIFKIVGY